MKITAIEPRYGSKRTMSKRIVAELGEHSAYFSPTCGSLAVEFAKPESSHETLNDLDGNLINLARVIADESQASALYGRLARILFDEQRRDESIVALRTATDPIDRAFHYFIVCWFGRNGFSGTVGFEKSSFAVRWTPNGGHGGQRFASAVESIPSWHQRLRRATILNRDCFEVIAKIDDHPKTAIYVDPPYLEKSARYIHDFKPEHHERLAAELRRFKQARVVVSYYRHPLLATLYPEPQWTMIDCTMTKGIHNSGRRGGETKEAPEVLLINGDSYTSGTNLFN